MIRVDKEFCSHNCMVKHLYHKKKRAVEIVGGFCAACRSHFNSINIDGALLYSSDAPRPFKGNYGGFE